MLVGGQIIEEIDHYNRARQMLHLLTPSERRTNIMVEGFGGYNETSGNSGIYAGRTKTVAFKPTRGLFNQPTHLPVRYCPNISELELTDAMEAVYGGGNFESRDYIINNVQLMYISGG